MVIQYDLSWFNMDEKFIFLRGQNNSNKFNSNEMWKFSSNELSKFNGNELLIDRLKRYQ